MTHDSRTITLPSLIDCHVHFREPGLEHKGTMATEAAAALAGGVTTVCEMPNTKPPTVTVAAFADKVRRAESLKTQDTRYKNFDIRFFFGVTEMGHLEELRSLWTDPAHATLKARCCGVKLYLDHSTGNQKAEDVVVEEAFRTCAELDCLIVAHCEDADINAAALMNVTRDPASPRLRGAGMGHGTTVDLHSRARPPESEEKSIRDAIAMAKKYGTRFHIAHLSTKGGLDTVRAAKKEGLPVTCEVAPHHLFLTTDDYATLGTLVKMNPPLRTKDHQEALWEGITDGTIDCCATDHAPHTLEEKRGGNPLGTPSGVPGVATMLPLLITVAAGKWPGPKLQTANYKLQTIDIVRLCFTNHNRIFRLGKDPSAVHTTIDPDAEWIIRGRDLPSKCGWSPYEGWRVWGKIIH